MCSQYNVDKLMAKTGSQVEVSAAQQHPMARPDDRLIILSAEAGSQARTTAARQQTEDNFKDTVIKPTVEMVHH